MSKNKFHISWILLFISVFIIYWSLNTLIHEIWHYSFWKLFWFDWYIEVHKIFWITFKDSWFEWIYKITDYWYWLQTNFQLFLMYSWWMIFEFLFFLILISWIYSFTRKKEIFQIYENKFSVLFTMILLTFSFILSFYWNIIEDKQNDWRNIKMILNDSFWKENLEKWINNK